MDRRTGAGRPDDVRIDEVCADDLRADDLRADDLRTVPDTEGVLELLRASAEGTGDVFYVLRVEPDLAMEFISDSCESLVGYTAAEHYANPGLLDLIVDQRDQALLWGALGAPFGHEIDVELRWLHRDGRVVWTHHRARKRRRDDGSAVLEGSGRNITVLRETQQALAQSEARYRFLVDESSDLVAIHEPDGTLRWISPAIERLLGWTAAERMAGDLQLFHPDDVAKVVEARVRLQGGAESATSRVRLRHSDDTYRWMDSTARAVRDAEGAITALHVVTRDVEDQVRAEAALAESESRFRLLAENASDVVYLVRPDGVLDWVSPSIKQTLGWDPADLIGTSPWALVHPHDGARTADEFARILTAPAPSADFQFRLRHRDGSYRWFSATGRPVHEDGHFAGFVVGLHDVNDRVLADRAKAASENQVRMAMAVAPQGIALLDPDRRFVEVNPALCRILGRQREWLLAHGIDDLIDEDGRASDQELLAGMLAGQSDRVTVDRLVRRGDGVDVWVQHAIGLLRGPEGEPQSYVSQFQDITRARRTTAHLAYQASHDRLTGMLSRDEITARLGQALAVEPVGELRLAVLFCDVDNLKAVNDTLGHAAGDALLVAISTAIRSTVRRGDTVGRYGGDEFVVLLPGVSDAADAARVARHVMTAAAAPVEFGGAKLRPSLSVGLTVAGAGDDVDEVLSDADAALYTAKSQGRDQVVVFSPGLQHPAPHS
jgi:diguanylate cyclase (GGDEF)-like protein/PAS domain S-box-containing protein